MGTRAKIGLAVCGAILVLALAIIFIWSGQNISEPDPIDENTILNINKPEETTNTPIEDGVVRDDLKDEPILNETDGFWEENRTPTTIYDQEIAVPENAFVPEYEDPFTTGVLDGVEFVEHYGYAWLSKVYYHPIAGSTMAFYNQLAMSFKDDPNEKKEQLIYIVDSFRSEFNNVLYQNNSEIYNIADIPPEGLYILSSTDTSWVSLRITAPSSVNGRNSFNIYLTGITKRSQIVLDMSPYVDAEVERIRNIQDYLGIDYVWDSIRSVGTQYIPDASQTQPKEPEDYTTEDEMLLQTLGIF